MMAATRGGRRRRDEADNGDDATGATGDPTIAAEPVKQLSFQGHGLEALSSSQTGPDFDLYALALASVRGIGVQVLRQLIDQYADLRLFWDDDTPSMRDALARAKAKDSAAIAAHIASNRARLLEEADRTRRRLADDGVRLLGAEDPLFPDRLRELPDAPYWLFVEGNPAVLHSSPLIGIVGTRQPSRQGIQATKRFTWLVTEQGFGVVSGLADGIDAAAHARAFSFQAPQVGVLGNGIKLQFPSSTRSIRRRIVSDGGAVITEYFPDDLYDRSRFVQRDRIQAGLASVVVPIESRVQSGTAHTVRFAERYRRPLMAVYQERPAPTNEIIGFLHDRGYPTFDVAKQADIEQMFAFLRSIVGDQWPAPPPPRDPRMLYRHVLAALDELEADVPLSEADHRWFLDHVTDRYNLRRRSGGPGRDS